MPAENLKQVRRRAAAFTRGDLEGAIEQVDPAAEFELPAEAGEPHTFRGAAGYRAAIRRWVGEWDAYEPRIDRYLPAGEHVVVLARESGYERDTGHHVQRRTGAIVTFRDGLVVRCRLFASWAEALEDVGLDPALAAQTQRFESLEAHERADGQAGQTRLTPTQRPRP